MTCPASSTPIRGLWRDRLSMEKWRHLDHQLLHNVRTWGFTDYIFYQGLSTFSFLRPRSGDSLQKYKPPFIWEHIGVLLYLPSCIYHLTNCLTLILWTSQIMIAATNKWNSINLFPSLARYQRQQPVWDPDRPGWSGPPEPLPTWASSSSPAPRPHPSRPTVRVCTPPGSSGLPCHGGLQPQQTLCRTVSTGRRAPLSRYSTFMS